jgi:dTDP-4-dehydrorhamnose 3,5-epimerase-like enzyme
LEWTLHWKDPIVDVRWPVAETYNVSEKDQRGVYLGDALEVLRG